VTESGSSVSPEEQELLSAFREYFLAFMRGSEEELSPRVSLPFFDVRNGEITEMRSEAQLAGFRRGLLARMATLGVVSSVLKDACVLMTQDELALVQFENIRQAADGSSRGGTRSLAFMRRKRGAPWRTWMISVLRVYESANESHT